MGKTSLRAASREVSMLPAPITRLACTVCLITGLVLGAAAASPPDPAAGPRAGDHSNPALANPDLPFVPGEVLVGFRAGTPASLMGKAAEDAGAKVLRNLPRLATQRWKLPPGVSPGDMSRVLSRSPLRGAIEFVEPNYRMQLDA